MFVDCYTYSYTYCRLVSRASPRQERRVWTRCANTKVLAGPIRFVDCYRRHFSTYQCTSFDCLFVCGDFNVDFNHSSCRRSVLSAFMHSVNLVSVDCNFPIGYTYHRGDNLAQSWPDHILTYPYHSMLVSNVSTLSCVDNFSDHLPLSFSLNLSFPPHCSPVSVTHDSSAQDSKIPSVSWFKVTPSHNNQYCQCVACNLPQIPNELLACCAPHCVSH